MRTMWARTYWGDHELIEVEIDRETDCYFWGPPTRGYKHGKRYDKDSLWATWEEAKAALVARAEGVVSNAETDLAIARRDLAKMQLLTPPAEEESA